MDDDDDSNEDPKGEAEDRESSSGRRNSDAGMVYALKRGRVMGIAILEDEEEEEEEVWNDKESLAEFSPVLYWFEWIIAVLEAVQEQKVGEEAFIMIVECVFIISWECIVCVCERTRKRACQKRKSNSFMVTK